MGYDARSRIWIPATSCDSLLVWEFMPFSACLEEGPSRDCGDFGGLYRCKQFDLTTPDSEAFELALGIGILRGLCWTSIGTLGVYIRRNTEPLVRHVCLTLGKEGGGQKSGGKGWEVL